MITIDKRNQELHRQRPSSTGRRLRLPYPNADDDSLMGINDKDSDDETVDESAQVGMELVQDEPRMLRDNGMLRHSLATLKGEQDFKIFYRALIPRICPLSLFEGFFSLFAPSTMDVHACRPKGLQ